VEDYVVGVVGVGPVVETGWTSEIVIPLAAVGPFVSIDDEGTAAAVGRLRVSLNAVSVGKAFVFCARAVRTSVADSIVENWSVESEVIGCAAV
jgi:hypothetical protein